MTAFAAVTAEKRCDAPYFGWLASKAAVRLAERPAAAYAPDYAGGAIVGLARKAWSGVSATLIDVRCDGEVEADISAPTARLSVMLEEIGGPVDVVCAAARASRIRSGANRITVLAANTDACIRGQDVSFIRHLVLDFHVPGLAGIVDDAIDPARLFKTQLALSDERLASLCRQFGEECAADEPCNRLYGDGLSVALLRRLAALDSVPQGPLARGGLSPWQLRRVLDHLRENLTEDLPLRTLADLTGLSQSYFSRAFKASTGLAPHRWLVNARCDKAKQLLLETRLGLAEIALDAGFCDQAHFTRVFARTVGTSPGAWRRARLS